MELLFILALREISIPEEKQKTVMQGKEKRSTHNCKITVISTFYILR